MQDSWTIQLYIWRRPSAGKRAYHGRDRDKRSPTVYRTEAGSRRGDWGIDAGVLVLAAPRDEIPDYDDWHTECHGPGGVGRTCDWLWRKNHSIVSPRAVACAYRRDILGFEAIAICIDQCLIAI